MQDAWWPTYSYVDSWRGLTSSSVNQQQLISMVLDGMKLFWIVGCCASGKDLQKYQGSVQKGDRQCSVYSDAHRVNNLVSAPVLGCEAVVAAQK